MTTLIRCPWAEHHALETVYHDEEWGVPKYEDNVLFESLCLESMQSGLSWLTVLKKRQGYRDAFFNFDIEQVAELDENDIDIFLNNENIIRHAQKIKSIINNAKMCMKLRSDKNQQGDLSSFLWSFVGGKQILNQWEKAEDAPSVSDESKAMSKALKAYGFKFLGPTTCYAFMQATGMVNDHLVSCFRYKDCIQSTDVGVGGGH